MSTTGTELASGFISLSVRYGSAMQQINSDLLGLQRVGLRAGNDTGAAIRRGIINEASLDRSDLNRIFSGLTSGVRSQGNQAGQQFGNSFNSGAQSQLNRGDLTAGVTDGMGDAGDEAGAGFMAGFAARFASISSKAGPIGLALAATAGLGLIAGGALANEVIAGFERDMSRRTLQVQLGLDESSVRNVSDAVANAYKNNFGESIEALNETAASVLKNGLATADDPLGLQKLIEQFETVTVVSGYTGDELARAVGTMVKSGVAADAASALDLITKAAQSGIDVHGDLLDTLTEYSVQFQKVGIDGQQAMGLVKQLLDAGARNGDLAADAIKEFAIRSIDGSQSTIDAYTALGLSAEEMMQTLAAGGPGATEAFDTIVDKINSISDPVARETLGVALFGTQFEDLAGAMRALDPSTAVDAIGEVEGAVQSASDVMGSGPTAGFEAFGRTMEVLRGKFQDFLAKAFGPMAAKMSAWITEQLPKISEFVEGKVIPAIHRLGDAFGTEWLANFQKTWPEMKKFGEALKRAFDQALPGLKLAATAIGALVMGALKLNGVVAPVMWQGMTWLVNAFIDFREKAGTAIEAISTRWETFKTAMTTVWQSIQSVFSSGWAVVQTVFNAIKTAISTVGEAFRFVFNDFVLPMWHNFQRVVELAWSVISPIWDQFSTSISAVGTVFSTVFSSVFAPVWENIKSVFSTGWNFLSGIFETMKSAFSEAATFLGTVWDGVSTLVSAAFDGILEAIKKPLRAVGTVILDFLPESNDIAGFEIPGYNTLKGFGEKLQGLKHGTDNVRGPGGVDNVLAWLTAGEGVVTKSAMQNGGRPLVAALNAGWVPPVDLLRAMLPGFANGSLGVNQEIGQVEEIAKRYGLTLSSGREGREGETSSFHSSGQAGDFVGPVENMLAFAKYMYGTYGSNLAELIFDHGSMPQLINDGTAVDPSFYGQNDHWDHVHVAIRSGSQGVDSPGTNDISTSMGTQLGDLTTSSSQSEVASAIGGEASRRGYSQEQTAAIISTALQESGLNPTAVSPNGLWRGIFQQDSSYAGRDDPNQNISEFFNRLEEHGGTMGDIWKNIFWLQQRPGESSADDAFSNGRQDYLSEIQSQLSTANDLLAEMPTASDYQSDSANTDSSTDTSSSSDNPYLKIMEGISEILPDFGSLAGIGADGLKETFLPPGFSDPTQWDSTKSGAALLNFAGGLIGGIPGLESVGTVLGGISSAITGDASGATNSFMSFLPQPFGDAQIGSPDMTAEDFQASQHIGSGALPGLGDLGTAFVPDPNNLGSQTVNNDNSVHVAENGQIGTDPVRVVEASRRQQTAQQNTQLGTRRFM